MSGLHTAHAGRMLDAAWVQSAQRPAASTHESALHAALAAPLHEETRGRRDAESEEDVWDAVVDVSYALRRRAQLRSQPTRSGHYLCAAPLRARYVSSPAHRSCARLCLPPCLPRLTAHGRGRHATAIEQIGRTDGSAQRDPRTAYSPPAPPPPLATHSLTHRAAHSDANAAVSGVVPLSYLPG